MNFMPGARTKSARATDMALRRLQRRRARIIRINPPIRNGLADSRRKLRGQLQNLKHGDGLVESLIGGHAP